MSADETVRFIFDGRPVVARRGQTVAGALYAAGVTTLTRSPKYRRPRGIHCAGGYCPNCLLRVDGRPHVRACMTPATEGLVVETEGSTAARVDPLRVIDKAGPLFPVGFQYRYFKRQGPLWRLWEGRLRKAAAETEVPELTDVPDAERIAADLLVVGGGPAGVGAAAAASDAGLSVVLTTRRPVLGGGLRAACAAGAAPESLTEALETVGGSDRVTALAPATVVAGFDGAYLVDAGDRLVEVTAGASVLATGAYERALVFPGNDRPGVMLTSALRRLALEEGVVGGRTAALVVADDRAYAMAAELRAAGVALRAVLDERAEGPSLDGVEVVRGARVTGVNGRGVVRGVSFEVGGERRTIACDVVGMSGGWQPADELRYATTSAGQDVVEGQRAAPLRASNGAGRALPVLQAVGAVAGTWDAEAALAEGRRAGAWAAAGVDHA